ncbi:hypothetical protein ACNKHM_19535 [Shigella sonnei]
MYPKRRTPTINIHSRASPARWRSTLWKYLSLWRKEENITVVIGATPQPSSVGRDYDTSKKITDKAMVYCEGGNGDGFAVAVLFDLVVTPSTLYLKTISAVYPVCLGVIGNHYGFWPW